TSQPEPARYVSSRSTLLLSFPDAFVPSLTHWLRMSCWSRSMTSASACRLGNLLPPCQHYRTRVEHPDGRDDRQHRRGARHGKCGVDPDGLAHTARGAVSNRHPERKCGARPCKGLGCRAFHR